MSAYERLKLLVGMVDRQKKIKLEFEGGQQNSDYGKFKTEDVSENPRKAPALADDSKSGLKSISKASSKTRKRNAWTPEEDRELITSVLAYLTDVPWSKITAEKFPARGPTGCYNRWNTLKNRMTFTVQVAPPKKEKVAIKKYDS
ncbi:hypothetical protein G9A89_003370 [Geosiphon pyriformis]|nr:hypothetical protein G9A89_003370 [Geosiphon pyriformis]